MLAFCFSNSLLSCRQSAEMSNALKDLNTTSQTSVEDINVLTVKQFEDRDLAEGRLTSEIEALHQQQRADYRGWLMSLVEKMAIDPSPL